MGPPPSTRTVSPGITLSFLTAPMTQLTGSAKMDWSSGRSLEMRTIWVSGATAYCANTPSICTPMERISVHRFALPDRQAGHTPQGRLLSRITWSPTRSARTSGPASTTSPTHSWPRMMPGTPGTRCGSARMATSVPQMLAPSTLILTSFAPLICGSGRSVYSYLPMAGNVTAFIILYAFDMVLSPLAGNAVYFFFPSR